MHKAKARPKARLFDGGLQAAAMFSALIGILRKRLPVAANTALPTAGPISAVAGSPTTPRY